MRGAGWMRLRPNSRALDAGAAGAGKMIRRHPPPLLARGLGHVQRHPGKLDAFQGLVSDRDYQSRRCPLRSAVRGLAERESGRYPIISGICWLALEASFVAL